MHKDAPLEERGPLAGPRLRLAGRAALVTRADEPVGEAVARRFGSEGATVFPWRANSTAALEDPDAARGVVDQALGASNGRLDLLVVGAGAASTASFESETLADWRAVIRSDLRAAFLLCQAAAVPLVAADGGAIVTFAGIPAGVASGAALSGLASMTCALAVELGPRVRANAVRFGSLDGSAGPDRGVAGAIAFLASADAAYVTGQVLNVDAGDPAAALATADARGGGRR